MRDKNRGNADRDGERATDADRGRKRKKLYEEEDEGKLRFWERREAGYRLFFFFGKSSDVRLAGCPQRTAEKSI